MTYRQPASEGSDRIPPPKAVPGRAQPVVTVMSADQQMRLAAVNAASKYFAGEATRTYNSERQILPLAFKLYDFIKEGKR